jgi:hypothetical protein
MRHFAGLAVLVSREPSTAMGIQINLPDQFSDETRIELSATPFPPKLQRAEGYLAPGEKTNTQVFPEKLSIAQIGDAHNSRTKYYHRSNPEDATRCESRQPNRECLP